MRHAQPRIGKVKLGVPKKPFGVYGILPWHRARYQPHYAASALSQQETMLFNTLEEAEAWLEEMKVALVTLKFAESGSGGREYKAVIYHRPSTRSKHNVIIRRINGGRGWWEKASG